MHSKESSKRPIDRQGLQGLVETAEIVLNVVSEGIALFFDPKAPEPAVVRRQLTRLLFEQLDVRRLRSTGKNEHLVRGVFAATKQAKSSRSSVNSPRIADLIILHCNLAKSEVDKEGSAHVLFPSPLYVAMQALTVPEDPHSQAYAIVALRLILSRRFNVWPAVSFCDRFPESSITLTEADIVREFRLIRTFADHRDNRSGKAPVKQFVSHFLAMKGIHLLRLPKRAILTYLRSKPFSLAVAKRSKALPEFRISKRYVELPEAATVVNEILGVPIALRGADTILFGGIKPSADHSLVMAISGGPGTGKTSFALALAAALAPIDTHTLYLSFEENADDLRSKLATQGQPRLNRLSFRYQDDRKWFLPTRLTTGDLNSLGQEIEEGLSSRVRAVAEVRRQAFKTDALLPPLPLMVVLDSISALPLEAESADPGDGRRTNPRQVLAKFVEHCRTLGALVILVASADGPIPEVLDYLVDVSISLRVKDNDDHSSKPLRLATLSKSRQQMARHGTHVFHLSGESGFRFAPQLSSQMDARQPLERMLWDRSTRIETFNVHRLSDDSYKYSDTLSPPSRSHILIQGHGSAGKSGLALKCALAPRFIGDRFDPTKAPPRTMVVSFLYPAEYYEDLRRKILDGLKRESPALSSRGFNANAARHFVRQSQGLGFIHFAPGFLSGEDLYSRLLRGLERATLEGRPFTDVVIDGLHNLALQFPGARDTEVLWSVVYGTLSRMDVTTITIFTKLELREAGRQDSSEGPEGMQFRLRTHLPLMHALVQSSDYVINVNRSQPTTHYEVSFDSAIDMDDLPKSVRWNRRRAEFIAQPQADSDQAEKSGTESDVWFGLLKKIPNRIRSRVEVMSGEPQKHKRH